MDSQGWYGDPFEAHEARWFSAGAPTALVRDGELEKTDPPPADSWDGPLTPVPDEDLEGGSDLQRSGEWDRHLSLGGSADGFAAADAFLG